MQHSRQPTIAIWRTIIVVAAAYSALHFTSGWLSLRTFTVQVNLFVAVFYVWLVWRHATSTALTAASGRPVEAWRGGLVVYAALMCIIYELFGGVANLTAWQALLAHVIVPLLVLVDWLALPSTSASGRLSLRQPWWWLAYPVAYVGMTYIVGAMVHERYLKYQYNFLNPTRPHFLLLLGFYLVLLLTLSYVVIGLQRLSLAWRRHK